MGRPQECNPCCGRQLNLSEPGYCTHRRYDDEGASGTVQWSRNISPSQSVKAAVWAMATDSSGNVYSAGSLNRLASNDSVIEARDADGGFLWRVGIPARIEAVTVSGSALWAVGARVGEEGIADNVFKLDLTDGEILWSGHITVLGFGGHITQPVAVVADGASGVYVGGMRGFGAHAFIVRKNSSGASLSEFRFDDYSTALLNDLERDSDGNLYPIGEFELSSCTGGAPTRYGPVVKLTSAYATTWVRTTQTRRTIGTAGAIAGDSVYIGLRGGCIWRVKRVDADVTHARKATGVSGGEVPCSGINDMTASADGATIYSANGTHLVAHSASNLTVAWCEIHGGEIDGEQVSACYLAVAAGPDASPVPVYAGGYATACDPAYVSPPASCGDSACTEPDCGGCGDSDYSGNIQVGECGCDNGVPCNPRVRAEWTGCLASWPTDTEAEFVGFEDAPTPESGNPVWRVLFTWACEDLGVGVPSTPTVEWRAKYVCGSGWSLRILIGGVERGTVAITSESCETEAGYPGFTWTYDLAPEDVATLTGCCGEGGTGCGGFGDPCPPETIDVCGCTDVPTTLIARVVGSTTHTVTTTWDGVDTFRGTFNCNGCELEVYLTCLESGATIGIDFTDPGCSGCGGSSPASIMCDPFVATDTGFAFSSCPCLDPGSPWSVTFSET